MRQSIIARPARVWEVTTTYSFAGKTYKVKDSVQALNGTDAIRRVRRSGEVLHIGRIELIESRLPTC